MSTDELKAVAEIVINGLQITSMQTGAVKHLAAGAYLVSEIIDGEQEIPYYKLFEEIDPGVAILIPGFMVNDITPLA